MTLKNVIYILKETRPFSDIGTADADRWVKTREKVVELKRLHYSAFYWNNFQSYTQIKWVCSPSNPLRFTKKAI